MVEFQSALFAEALKFGCLAILPLTLLCVLLLASTIYFTLPATIMASQTSKPLPYTANPLLLIANDLVLFLQITITWPITAGLPSIVLPLWPTRAGALDELAFTLPNIWTIFQHLVLIVAQVGFILSLIPLALVGLPLFYFLYIVGFVVGNKWASGLINGPRRPGGFQSHPDCVKGKWPKHDNEEWVFINGVAVG